MTAEAQATAPASKTPAGGAPPVKGERSPQIVSRPDDVASLVLMQIDAVNSRKDDLTIAIKALADTTKQLVRAYARQSQAIAALRKQVKELEDQAVHK